MEQTKALNALEPFLALSKSANSPRAAADLITHAISAPNTYVFAELLQTPQIQALAQSSEFAPHLDLLNVFSHGTYQSYRAAAASLPTLDEHQLGKLRQLSLLTLARDRANLSYGALQQALDLASPRQLEDLVIKAVYQGLLQATLDPARQAVNVTSVAPLRDLEPGSIPDLAAALKSWSDRCDVTLADIEAQISGIHRAAAVRAAKEKAADERVKNLIDETLASDGSLSADARDTLLPRKALNKRVIAGSGSLLEDGNMELDEQQRQPDDHAKRASKRKM